MQSLYAVEPDGFMAARSALVAEARQAGESSAATEIGRLRKPSLAGWAVNLAAREAKGEVAHLVELGDRMREAQSRLDAAALTTMRPERDAAVEAFVSAVVDRALVAGRRLSATVQQDVRATAIAALADARAAEAVASGQLTRALSYSGFGEVDLAEAVARTAGGAILTVIAGEGGGQEATGREDTGESAAEGDDAASGQQREAALERARAALADAEREVTRARERAEETRERLAVVERQLAKAREADERALGAVTEAVRARKVAESALAALGSRS